MAFDKHFDPIEGAKAKKLYIPRDGIDTLNVSDINNKLLINGSVRCVNPLNPTYKWKVTDDPSKKSEIVGFIEGSLSRNLHKEISQPFSKISSSDI